MFPRSALSVAGVSVLMALASAPSALAQLPTYGLGRTPTGEEIRAWDVMIGPDGKGLPPGSGTAVRGWPVFLEKCAPCHGEAGDKPKFPWMNPLVGGRGTLATDKPVTTIGSFWPYATSLWSYIKRSQPFDSPGSLTADEVYAVTAYLLYMNGLIGKDEVVDPRTLPRVTMPNRDGFVPDPRPDVGKPSKTTRP